MKHTITATTHRQVVIETLEYLGEYREKWDKTPAVVTYADGHTNEFRVAVGTEGSLMRMWPRSSRHGSRIPTYLAHTNPANEKYLWRSIVLNIPAKTERTPAQWYARRLRNRRDYFLKHAYPTVWGNLWAECEQVTDDKLAKLEETNCTDRYAAWRKAKQLDLPQVEPHKTLTIRSCKPPSHIEIAIQQDMAARKDFSYSWRGDYDYCASGKMCADGIYRAWLSQEFKGCGNGHYWLLISGKHCIFAEDD